MNRTLVSSAVVTLSLMAFSADVRAKPSKPDWVDGPSMEYPRGQYLTGVGMGDERATAEDRARGEIARVFSTAVTVKTHLTESETNTTQGSKSESNFSQAVDQSVETVSQKVLQDVSVVESWKDEAVMKYYALAVLDRAKSKTAFTEKLQEFDKEIAKWKESLDGATERLGRVRAAMKLLAVLKARSELNEALRVVDASGKGLPAPIDEAEVRPQAAKALAALNVFVDLSGEGAKPVATGIIKGLAGTGLQAKVGQSDDADITIEATIETTTSEGKDEWKWARSTATVSLKDARASKTFLQFDAFDREASADSKEAVRRSRLALGKKVSAKVGEAITEYFENQ